MPPAPTRTDVVVIGAGIAGLVTALELLDHGRKVVLLDRSIDPWQRPEDRAPQPVDLDLGPLAGTAVRFTWVTESIAPSVLPLPRAGWGRPRLVVAERRCAG